MNLSSVIQELSELNESYNAFGDRQTLITNIKSTGRRYRFNKYSDEQLFYIWKRIQEEPPIKEIETPKEVHITYCDECGRRLTDGGYCPVCDDGAEDFDFTDENLFEGIFDASKQANTGWVQMFTANSQQRSQSQKVATNTNIVTIVYDKKAHKLRARADDGIHGEANVAFPNNLRNQEGQQYEVEELTWNGKNYRASGTITSLNSVSNTQNINEKINKEICEMNFQTVLEELDKLYEEIPAEPLEEASAGIHLDGKNLDTIEDIACELDKQDCDMSYVKKWTKEVNADIKVEDLAIAAEQSDFAKQIKSLGAYMKANNYKTFGDFAKALTETLKEDTDEDHSVDSEEPAPDSTPNNFRKSLSENAIQDGGFRTDGYRTALACYDSDDFDINVEFGLQNDEEYEVKDQLYLLCPGQTVADLVVYLSRKCGFTNVYVYGETSANRGEMKTATKFETEPGTHDYRHYGTIEDRLVENRAEQDGKPIIDEEPVEDEVKRVVIECSKCGALVVKDEADIKVDEASDLVNVDDTCQFCEETEGYVIVGYLVPYEGAEVAEEASAEEAAPAEEITEEEQVEEEEVFESLTEGKIMDSIKKVATRVGADAATILRCFAELGDDITGRDSKFYDFAEYVENKAALKALMSGNEKVLNTLTKDDIEELEQDIKAYEDAKAGKATEAKED